MKRIFIVANWKSHKNKQEATDWLKTFLDFKKSEDKEVIVCPSFTILPYLQQWIGSHRLPLSVGAQDVSPFAEGAFTGEVNARQVKEFADYVIIGHSERRTYFSETDEMVTKKVEMARQANLTPIFCVQGGQTPVPPGVEMVAYEPVSAIGTGNPDSPENAEGVIRAIKEKTGASYVLYGGSVTPENINSFTSLPSIDGVLVGGGSLDPKTFAGIIENA